MKRIVGILLCICLLIVCALVAWFGHQQMESSSRTDGTQSFDLRQITCEKLLNKVPRSQAEFELIDFYPGKNSVAIDSDEDGRWERAYIPVFEKPLKDIRQNYRAIVICFAGVADEIELRKQLQSKGLPAQYWPYSQKFGKETYNSLAERYSSLDFNRSIIVHCGFPKSAGMARYLLWGGAIGALFAIMAMGWQSLSLITVVIRKSAAAEKEEQELDDDEEETEFLNRAGLPTIKRE